MATKQVFNKRIDAWVKMAFGEDGSQIKNVKEREPTIPFKGIPIKRK